MLWHEMDRDALRRLLPESLVVVPVGAVEQHGPHLPTWTDALIVETVVRRAAVSGRFIVTPTVSFGASDHHLPFGGTLSLSAETMLAVLVDLCRSVAVCGGRRVALVNGHGGNRGACAAAAAAAASRYGLRIGYADYWTMWQPGGDMPPWPGHGGRFEASLVRAIRPELIHDVPLREVVPLVADPAGWEIHDRQSWRDIDGYTDDPALATARDGAVWLDALVAALASRLEELAC